MNSATRGELAEGYRHRAELLSELVDDLDGVSREANERLGDAPEW